MCWIWASSFQVFFSCLLCITIHLDFAKNLVVDFLNFQWILWWAWTVFLWAFVIYGKFTKTGSFYQLICVSMNFWVCARYQNFCWPWGMLDIKASNSTGILSRAWNKVKIRSSMDLLNSFEIPLSPSFPLWASCSHSFNKGNPPSCTYLFKKS